MVNTPLYVHHSKTMLCCIILLTATSLLYAGKEDMLNKCIDGKHHKADPGPEDDLHGQCTPWRNRSCCFTNTSHAAHNDLSYLYNFNWNHCGIMSEPCRQHFIQDTCFYECSPNLGPWIVTADESWRKERIKDVPLCKEDCDAWYNDCRNDMTCMDNWHKGWNWSAGYNQCPDRPCQKIDVVFLSAKDFCEKVWSNSYKYTEYTKDSGRCMQMWFDNGDVTPNVKVAEYYAKNSAHNPRLGLLLLLLAPLFTLWSA